MGDPQLRIFSYLPNPRVFKATITGRLCGVEVEVRGATPGELTGWLWDFDAHPLTDAERSDEALARQGRTGFRSTLYKTDAFLEAHPFGTVPAAFSPEGRTGIFESNSIMRTVARLAKSTFVYGRDAYEASRIDGFLDASLVFARDTQHYLLALGGDAPDEAIVEAARRGFQTWMGGLDRALSPSRHFLVGDDVTLADICFVAELALFSNERRQHEKLRAQGQEPVFGDAAGRDFPLAMAHFQRLCEHPAFEPDLAPYLEKHPR